ncbi:VOC family protein [Pseudomonas aeruginosa]|uniref:VOC family protein n=1 Tax=Pseudomonas aeruginosa TaxID=287 RepID=UPI00396724BA
MRSAPSSPHRWLLSIRRQRAFSSGRQPALLETSYDSPQATRCASLRRYRSAYSFYGDGLGLEILYRFEDHDGFDGVMLGHAGAPYHFEFTKAHGHTAGPAPTRDNLLVFYLPDPAEWQVAVERMEGAGFRAVAAFNPYRDRSGRTFEDPDGYRVVIQRADWNA